MISRVWPRSEAAVVVPTFNPDSDFAERLAGLASQASLVVVSDDGSTTGASLVAEAAAAAGCVLLRSTTNRGIAAALNAGVARAIREPGIAFVLTVDQDSVLASDYVSEAAAVLSDPRQGADRIAGVVAGQVDGSRRPHRPAQADVTPPGWELLQSGLVARAEALREVGPFDETLFIDCVDTEWGLRARSLGWTFVIAPGCVMTHGAGVELARRVPLVGTVRFSVHSPLRRFYIARNRALITARYGASAPGWAVRQVRSQLLIGLWGLIFGTARGRQLVGSLLGLGCAGLDRRGPAPVSVARWLAASPGRTGRS